MDGRSGCRSPRARRPRTSSTKPWSSMVSKRWLMRECSQARSLGSKAISRSGRRGLLCCRVRACHCDKGWPLMANTSKARAMRCESLGAKRCAVVGSMAASSACSAGQPWAWARASISARTTGLAVGMSLKPSIRALKYSMVPPTSRGMRPRACMSLIRAVASRTKSAALYACSGSRMSIRWCGTSANSAALGLAVPMSMPR